MIRTSLLVLALCATLSACQAASERPDEREPDPDSPPQTTRVDPADLVDCLATGRPSTEFDCQRAQRAEAAVKEGVGAIEWPRDLKRGRERTLYLTVGNAPIPVREANDGSLVDAVLEPEGETPSTEGRDGMEPSDGSGPRLPEPDPSLPLPDRETVPYTPLVGRFMSAELTGSGFEISPSGPVSQELPPNSTITWAWTVKPLRKGIQRLSVTTRVEFVDSDGDRVPLRASTARKDVDVKVLPLDEVRDWLTIWPDWLKLIGGLFTAIGSALAAWFGLRRVIHNRRETSKPDTEA